MGYKIVQIMRDPFKRNHRNLTNTLSGQIGSNLRQMGKEIFGKFSAERNKQEREDVERQANNCMSLFTNL